MLDEKIYKNTKSEKKEIRNKNDTSLISLAVSVDVKHHVYFCGR